MGRFSARAIEPGQRRRRTDGYVLLACALLALSPARSFAQPAETLRTFYVPTRSFNIPFTPTDMNPAIDVFLYVSSDGRNYRYVAAAKPADRRFHFTAPGDGWYYFLVQTRDAAGNVRPSNVNEAQPTIRICVDTQKPIIEVNNVGAPGRLPVLSWKVQDANFREFWADYRSLPSGDWIPLLVPSRHQGEYTWKPSIGGDVEVRFQARDQAGNPSEPKTLRIQVSEAVSGMSPPADTAGSIPVMHAKSKTFELTYELENKGPSGVKRINVFKMRPGMEWRKCTESGDGEKPITVTVETSGRWGFRLVPQNGVGLADPDPRRGDLPDIWVEVDDSKPQVNVTNVTVTPSPDGGYLTIYWKASDTFLRAAPIMLLYSANEQGPWEPITQDPLPNTGSWSQSIAELKPRVGNRYQFYLKVTADDEAGNRGEAQWRDVVKIDLQIPRVKSIKLQPREAPPAENGPQSFRVTPRVPPRQPAPAAPIDPPFGGGSLLPSAPTSVPRSPLNASGTNFSTPQNNPR